MKVVITYGTFDLFHYGHLDLLRRARSLGDKLIVGLSTDEFNECAKQKQTYHSYDLRYQNLQSIKFVDMIFPEQNWEQKESDIALYGASIFTIGDDWLGKFDYLKSHCEVVYLSRTPDISSSLLKVLV